MPRRGAPRPLATLWKLAWNGDRISCAVYRRAKGDGLEVRLESADTTILAEPLDLQPRALARLNALKRSLKRRGWEEPRAGRDG